MRARPIAQKEPPVDQVTGEPPCCGNCPFYVGRHATAEAYARAEAAGHPAPPGDCRRYPQKVSKHPNDLCGEHPAFEQKRAALIARLVGRAVADLPVP
ncbi:MAG TPA: hypothetical protein VGR70_09885 [Stellaceae bacterium]|nr:hypothetical protein [Stellaceae bacterium]